MRRRPVGKVDRSWASLSSLPPSLAMAPLVPWAQHHDSDLLTQAQWILPSFIPQHFYVFPTARAQRQAPPSLVLPSAYFLSLMDNYASAVLASNQSHPTAGPLH